MIKPPRSRLRDYAPVGVATLVWWGFWAWLFSSGKGGVLALPVSRLGILVTPLIITGIWLFRLHRRLLQERDEPDYAPDLSLIDALNNAANLGANRSQLLVRLADGTRAAFSSSGANVYLLDEAQEYLVLASDSSFVMADMGVAGTEQLDRPRVKLDDSTWYATALQANEPIITNRLEDIVAMASEFEGAEKFADILPNMLQTQGISSVMTVPIRDQGRVAGLVDMSRGWAFTDHEADRFRVVCEQLALVLSRMALDERLSKSESLYRALADLTPDLIFLVNGDGGVVLANPAAARFVEHPLPELEGSHIDELFGPMGVQFENHLTQVQSTGRPLDTEDHLVRDRSEVWLKTSLVPLTDVAPGFVLGVSRDISDSKQLEQELRRHTDEVERQATHDTLTGLSNRRAFMVALDHAIALAQRGTVSTVLFMDIDGFKRCNDERGHAFGDEVLVSVASLALMETREVDLVSRVGGDEYAVLLAGTDERSSAVVAERMSERVHALGSRIGIPIGLSVGAAEVQSDHSAVDIIAIADQRMYERKNARGAGRTEVEKTWPFRHPNPA